MGRLYLYGCDQMGKCTSGGRSSAGVGGSMPKLANPREQIDYPQDEQTKLYDYTESSHINYELGVIGYNNMSDTYKEMADTLDTAISKSGWTKDEFQTGMYRGGGGVMIGVSQDQTFQSKQDLVNFINNNLIGVPTTNAGYTSITGTFSVAKSFSSGEKNAVILEYGKIGKGMRGAYVSGGNGKKAISYYGTDENETILQRNVKTTPVMAYLKDNRVHVVVTADP